MSKFISRFQSPFGKPVTSKRTQGHVMSDRALRRHPDDASQDIERDLTDEEVAKMRAAYLPEGFVPFAPSAD